MTENLNSEEIKNRAKELVEKHGKAAVEIAKRKADAFKSECREKDFALMLLTEVEKMAENLT
ncbi:MAG: hypothetical protein KGP29_02625 [Proteobacteria bacterium]|nr:hypothetical protein [Pseudomonadota bacterium]